MLEREITAVTEAELRAYSDEVANKHLDNMFSGLFYAIAEAITTHNLKISKTVDRIEDSTSPSDLFHSSDEDKPENDARNCLLNLVRPILTKLHIILQDKYEFKWYTFSYVFFSRFWISLNKHLTSRLVIPMPLDPQSTSERRAILKQIPMAVSSCGVVVHIPVRIDMVPIP